MKDTVERYDGKIKRHLMMDEIKLKNGIMWTCMNGEVTGFIADELNTKNLMLNILMCPVLIKQTTYSFLHMRISGDLGQQEVLFTTHFTISIKGV